MLSALWNWLLKSINKIDAKLSILNHNVLSGVGGNKVKISCHSLDFKVVIASLGVYWQ